MVTSICALLTMALFAGLVAPVAAIPPPPPNPSDQQIQDSQSQASSTAAQVGRLSGQVTATEGDISRLNNDLELKAELVKKAIIDQQLAQADAVTAGTAARNAARIAAAAGSAITQAQNRAAAFAAASFRQGSVLGSMSALMDASSISDLLARQEMIKEISKSQLGVIATLQTSLSDKANLDSDARVARDRAAVAQSQATAAAATARTAMQTADDAFVAGKVELASLNVRLETEQNAYQVALSRTAGLQNQRATYNTWLAAKKAEEARLRREAIARAKAAAAARAAAVKAAAARAAAQARAAAAQARAAAAERARLVAAAAAASRAAAIRAAAVAAAQEQAARIAKKRFDDQQAALAAAAAKAAAQAQAAAESVFYPDCAAAVAAGAAPIHRGSPGYRTALDSNGNGVACEVLSGGAGAGGSPPAPADPDPPAAPAPPAASSGGWTAAKGEAAVQAAERWIGTPYSWGGGNSSGPTAGICGPDGAANDCNVVGFDCSGLTSYAWAQEGISIPNYSVYQYTLGRHIGMSDLLPGDLLFYANDTSDPSTIHHVTMYAGGGMMVEAPFSGAYVHVTSAEFGNGFIGATRVGT